MGKLLPEELSENRRRAVSVRWQKVRPAVPEWLVGADLDRLSGRVRVVAEMRHAGKRPAEIAEELDSNENAVITALCRAKALLAKSVAADADESDADQLPGDEPPAVVRARLRQNGMRSKTIAANRLSREEWRVGSLTVYPDDVERPRTRGDCKGGQRPCPFVSCSHNLYLDVNPESGAIKLNFPHLEVDEMKESCSLDVADRDGVTLDQVGAALSVTRERVRQIEDKAIRKLKRGPSGRLLGLV